VPDPGGAAQAPTSAGLAQERIALKSAPPVAPLYLKSLFDRRPGHLAEGTGVGRIDGAIETISAPPALLERYRRVCGFPESPYLPISFPHVLAAGLHLKMLLSPVFPIRLPGLVHTWHEIEQEGPIPADASLHIESWIDGVEFSGRGAEFCLHTVIDDGAVRWREKTGFLARRRGPPPTAKTRTTPPPDPGPEPEFSPVARFDLEPDLGRRYARASGDYNPIHLYRITARAFGFKAAIAHGMWSLARCAATLLAAGTGSARLHLNFRRPLLLPGAAVLEATDGSGERRFRLRDPGPGSVFLDGWTGSP
jgi:hypothetical protein